MSYILDALKKSEQERERGNIPDLQSIHQPVAQESTSSHVWIYIILASIILAAVITTAWRTYMPHTPHESSAVAGSSPSQTQSESAAASTSVVAQTANTATAANSASTATAANSASTATAANSASAETKVTQQQPDQIAQARQQPAPKATTKPRPAQLSEPVTEQSTPESTVEVDEPKTSSNVVFLEQEIPANQMYSRKRLEMPEPELQEPSAETSEQGSNDMAATSSSGKYKAKEVDIPNLTNLPAAMRKTIPDISFSGHVYNSVAARRSIIINDKFMREGEYVTPEIKVEEITSRGAIFRYKDTLFRLGALQDWSNR